MKFKLLFLISLVFQFAFSQQKPVLIPYPQELQFHHDHFQIPSEISVMTPKGEQEQILSELQFFNHSESKFFTSKKKNAHISFGILPPKTSERHPDYYELKVHKNNIIISSDSERGRFYGINTLSQLMEHYKDSGRIPTLTIRDFPELEWRGMHLDVCRHFFTVDEVKKYIDYLAMYKLNNFHWHLTDDQGWRIEIKKYPKLTEVGAWRNGSMIGHYSEQRFDDKHYGGFYTQDQIREVVKHAADRHINIVPEIEMPGHAVAAIASYSHLGCTGKQIEVEKMWGVFDDIFCPKEETFSFLEDVLTEVMALFPSEIIHIGGDEAPKTRWKECAHCQALIKKEGLKDEHGLQSYFITRIEKFVNSKGRKIIGWDEILEGGLAPNAAVMSWRGTEGGIAAAKSQHYAVMSPGSHMYFDHYQGDPKHEPVGFGGFTPLEKVYSFEPIPKELVGEERKYILGAQANLWTEYINNFPHVEYMMFPRVMALSEVLWGTAKPDQYSDFQQRVFQNFPKLDKMGVNYSRSLFNVGNKSEPANNGKDALLLSLNGFDGTKNIRYTTDGTEPNANSELYHSPLPINKTTVLKAAYFEDGAMKSKVMEQKIYVTKSTGKKISLKDMPDQRYYGIGAETLIDGLKGDPAKFGKDWLGFLGDVETVIDFGASTPISSISMNFVNANSSWIHLPKSVEIYSSENGKDYRYFTGLKESEIKDFNGHMEWLTKQQYGRYFKIIIKNAGIIPEGFAGAGYPAWLFVDEIGME